ncbi:cupin domain-containing protein [Cellulomonas oligotrophica]|uniref:Cupin n=1 Tax=Cellulomonas oligotrophica TaxID=931536 RepID=A0A7Y9JZF1_9CELL|nr:cupin domain-containing protein [Cellulomonas oligotrophica]NYD86135.1 quercetin dioxygenase-like cupin family protein [Cellulomonas oligotrophica]GIG30857.1 cupin [Cellulomonas oligotrophica]
MPDEQHAPVHLSQPEPFRWDGVAELVYKESDTTFRDVTRRVLAGADAGQGVELRYFEVGPGGHTTLEHHAHTHVVVPVRGHGRALVGRQVLDLAPHDVVVVGAWEWHQLRAPQDTPFGFLCLVTTDRDRPVRPTDAELADLRADPVVAEFVRV